MVKSCPSKIDRTTISKTINLCLSPSIRVNDLYHKERKYTFMFLDECPFCGQPLDPDEDIEVCPNCGAELDQI